MSLETQTAPSVTIAESIEAVTSSFSDETKAQIKELESHAYNNSLPAGERLKYIGQLISVKEQAADDYVDATASEVIGEPEALFPSRQEVARHIGHAARTTWQILTMPVSDVPSAIRAQLST